MLLLLIIFVPDPVPSGAQAAEAESQEAPWRVLETAGSVRYLLPGGASWAQAAVGDALPPGSRIVTGAAGTLVIERAGETVTMAPSARLMLPPGYRSHRARQEVGTLIYEIEPTRARRFEVETPFAALVVKGTAFRVEVTDALVAVDVTRGRVEVTSRGEAAADLGAGHAARIAALEGAPLEVRRSADGPYVPVEPASLSWFDRFLQAVSSGPGSGSGAGDGSTTGTGLGGAGVGGGGVSVGGASVGGSSLGGASIDRGGVSVGGASVGGVGVGGASLGRGGVSVGGASVGGIGVGGTSIGGGGVSVGGIGIGDRN